MICFIQMHDLRWIRQYLPDEAAILWLNELVSSCKHYLVLSSCRTTATVFSEACQVPTYANCSVFTTQSVRLSQTAIDTFGNLLFSNNSIGCLLNFTIITKLPLWLISFFRVVTQAILVLFHLFVVEDNPQYYIYAHKKKILVTVLPLMFGMIYLMMFILPQLLHGSETNKILSLDKAFPSFHINYPASP